MPRPKKALPPTPELITTKSGGPEKVLENLILDKNFLMTDKVEEEYNKYVKVREMILKQKSNVAVMALLVKEGWSPREARFYVENCGGFWKSTMTKPDPELLAEALLNAIQHTKEKAEDWQDANAMAKSDANMINIIESILKTMTGGTVNKQLPNVEVSFRPEWFPEIPLYGSPEYELMIQKLSADIVRKKEKEVTEFDDYEIEP